MDERCNDLCINKILNMFPYLSLFTRYLQTKSAWPRLDLELVEVKCMPIKSPDMTLYMMAIAMFALAVAIHDICNRNVHDLEFPSRMVQGDM